MPALLHPSSIGITKRDIAAHSPIGYERLVLEMSTQSGFSSWWCAFHRALEEWQGYGVYEPMDSVPKGAKVLPLKMVLSHKVKAGVEVCYVRPVSQEFSGTSELAKEELYTPGLAWDSFRIITMLYLGFLDEGKDYGCASIDVKRAFPNSSEEVAREVWEGTSPLVVQTPSFWMEEVRAEFMGLLKAIEGLQSASIVWRITLMRALFELMTFEVSPYDPSLFVAQTPSGPLFVQLHGDDLRVVAPRAVLHQFYADLAKRFPVGELQVVDQQTPRVFCGVVQTLRVTSGRHQMHLGVPDKYREELMGSVDELCGKGMWSRLRGKLGWMAAVCAPDLVVLSRTVDDVLSQVHPSVVRQYVAESQGVVLSGLSVSQPAVLHCFADTSGEGRELTKLRARMGGLFVLCNPGGRGSLCGWYSRLCRRVAVGSDTNECRGVCECIEASLYLEQFLRWMGKWMGVRLVLTTTVHTDSQPLVSFILNSLSRTRDLDFLLLKELSYAVSVLHLPGRLNPADAVTKLFAAAREQYRILRMVMAGSLGDLRELLVV
eukprot:jgi/Mesvir1/20919/Mv26444-RA.1